MFTCVCVCRSGWFSPDTYLQPGDTCLGTHRHTRSRELVIFMRASQGGVACTRGPTHTCARTHALRKRSIPREFCKSHAKRWKNYFLPIYRYFPARTLRYRQVCKKKEKKEAPTRLVEHRATIYVQPGSVIPWGIYVF